MLVGYNGINGDDSKHVNRVEAMRKDNSIKLADKEEFIQQSSFDILITTFVSNKPFDNVVEFIKQ